MRSRISDRNILPDFSLKLEYKKLHDLFFDKSVFGRMQLNQQERPCYSYHDCLQAWFLDWKLRGTFTSVEEMESGLGISENNFYKGVTEEGLLDYIQYILNAIDFVSGIVQKDYWIYQAGDMIPNAIIANSLQILDHLRAELKKDDENGELFVVYKDDAATAVAEQDHELAPSIVEYLKIDNRHDLKRKGEILCTLAKKLELYEKKLRGTEFKSLCDDTTFLLNKTGARHCQNPDNKIEAQFMEMGEEELEKWYDKTFQMLLACRSVLPYLDYKTKISELRKGNA